MSFIRWQINIIVMSGFSSKHHQEKFDKYGIVWHGYFSHLGWYLLHLSYLNKFALSRRASLHLPSW